MFGLAGIATESPPLTGVKLNGTRRWPMSAAWVTELSRMNVTFAMPAPSGVSTNSVWPYATSPGVAPVIAGRGPRNRYGGE